MEQASNKKIFMVIDGSAIIHRAFHAMPPFTTSDGRPTGAVHGFFSMFLKLIQEIKPTYVAVTFDRPKPTFRQELFVGYHANRPKAPDGLGAQFGIVREILNEAKIPLYEIDGFEADDVIGTINKKVNDTMHDTVVYVITGDRDMLQLLDRDTKIVMPIKGISEVMIFDSARVKNKYGVLPEQIIDYKALTGDASDNYPGVAGVGPKTAATLLQEYGTLEGIYESISEIEAKNKNLALKLANGAEQAALAKKLATIVTDAPFVFSVEDCLLEKIIPKDLEVTFQKFELRTLSRRIHEVFGNMEKGTKSQMKLL